MFKDIKKELKAIETKIKQIESAGTKDKVTALQQIIDKLNQQSDALA
jgi:gamma-glutamyl phosphate reductase